MQVAITLETMRKDEWPLLLKKSTIFCVHFWEVHGDRFVVFGSFLRTHVTAAYGFNVHVEVIVSIKED